MSRLQVRADSTPVPVTDQITYPGPPPGFDAQVLFSAPAAATYDPNATADTLDMTFFAPALLSPDQIITAMQSFIDQAPTFGWTILAYEIDTQPVGQITVPSDICIEGLPCITLPSSICVPNLPPGNCWFTINLGGSTISTGYSYRLWLLVADPSGSALVAPFARAQVRAQLPALLLFGIPNAIALVIALFGLLLVYEVITGKITLAQVGQTVRDITTGAGSITVPTIQAAENPMIILGIAMIITGVAVPIALNANATVPIPGGGSVGAGGSIGGGTGGRR